MVQEQDLSAADLAAKIKSFNRQKLTSMAVNARAVSKRNATDRVVAELTEATA